MADDGSFPKMFATRSKGDVLWYFDRVGIG